ncbi:MmgE/PrpD family protein [Shimia thalassica]|uniref:MmgE/PrpD family protein n=1 Tax=Shimia thalassica TaxID=1715693 RepID=UPI001C0A3A20|nr:MmgE/PrpD family protein [Shimia thalassica]MBU2941742.1 MmgE/PrpD family protein [Shimia thalassica]MDO6503877.1 MmgE/PrpD family protein [Shimia thalassica]
MQPSFQEFSETLSYKDVPPDVLRVLRRSFLDTMGVAAVGSTQDMSLIAKKGAMALFGTGGAGSARILMDGAKVSPAGAAMAGAFTVDSVDAHDGTSPCKGHAGAAVFPALLAVADAEASCGRPLDGKQFATLLAVAYEVSYRAGLAQHATCADYHTSGAWTAVGVATATAKLLGCNATEIAHAAGIGEYHGPRSQMMRCIDHPTMVRDGVGWGAPSGVTAAYLAEQGFTGAPALTCEGEDAAEFWSDLGSRWRLVEDTHYKPYPCCRWAHPAMDAAAELMPLHAIHHTQVESVEIRTFHNATRLAGQTPDTPDEFAYAIAFPVAALIVRGQVGVSELAPETLKDPDILRISKATQLIDDEHFTKISVGKRWAQVTLVLKDGTRLTSEPRTPRGDTDLPLTDQDILEKFHLFSDPVLGSARSKRIADMCSEFDTLSADQFGALLDLLLTAPN